LRLAWALFWAKRGDEAIAMAEASGDRSVEVRAGLIGSALVAAGRMDEARRLADELAAEDLDNSGLLQVARLYAKAGVPDRQIVLLKRRIERIDNAPAELSDQDRRMARAAARFTLAQACETAGDGGNAYEQYYVAALEGHEASRDWLAQHASGEQR